MSINEIRLKSGQLADLYGQQLIETIGDKEPIDLPMLGDFGKKVLILVNESAHAYLSDAGLKLLTGILTACNMSMADVGVVNLTASSDITAEAIDQLYKPNAWWIFGVDTASLGMQAMNSPGLPYSYKQKPVFWSPSLAQLDNDATSKRALWNQLKNHYGG